MIIYILLKLQVQAKDLSYAIAEQERKAAEQKSAIEADIAEQKTQAANGFHEVKEGLEQSRLKLEAAISEQKEQASKELSDVKVRIEKIQ